MQPTTMLATMVMVLHLNKDGNSATGNNVNDDGGSAADDYCNGAMNNGVNDDDGNGAMGDDDGDKDGNAQQTTMLTIIVMVQWATTETTMAKPQRAMTMTTMAMA